MPNTAAIVNMRASVAMRILDRYLVSGNQAPTVCSVAHSEILFTLLFRAAKHLMSN